MLSQLSIPRYPRDSSNRVGRVAYNGYSDEEILAAIFQEQLGLVCTAGVPISNPKAVSNHRTLRASPGTVTSYLTLASPLNATRVLSGVDSKVVVERDELVYYATAPVVAFDAAEHLQPQTAAQQLAGLLHPRQALALLSTVRGSKSVMRATPLPNTLSVGSPRHIFGLQGNSR